MTAFTPDHASRFPHRPLVAGIELGGTKCICTLATGPDDVLDQRTVPTLDPETTLTAIAGVLAEWWQGTGFSALGIASFGPLDLNPQSPRFGHILATTKKGWEGADIAGRLSAPYDVPMSLDTDVNGAAIAELRWGAGQGLADFAYITVGTGVGVGLVVNGQTVRGFGHCEMGHLRVPRLPGDNGPSSCDFHSDCVEGLASGSALKLAAGARHISDISSDDPVWARIIHAVACLCHALAATTAPHRIAVGGGVFARQAHLLPRLEQETRASLNGYLTLPEEKPYVIAPALGDQAGPMGPIALALGTLAPAGEAAASS